MNSIEKLSEYFSHFPGIGRRQSRRFVYFLLGRDTTFLSELATLIAELKDNTKACTVCGRYFATNSTSSALKCSICSDPNRDTSQLMIVEKDVDAEGIEKSGAYNGHYFILNHRALLTDTELSSKTLQTRLNNIPSGVQEIILALSATPESEHTAVLVAKYIQPHAQKHGITISTLGRGLSTGVELEYSDSHTIESALENRK